MVNKQKKQGFTLLEMILVLSIIMIGLVGVSSLILQNLRVEFINKHYLVGSMLAQEGVELVRNIRDNNWLIEANEWDLDISSGSGVDGTFTIDHRVKDGDRSFIIHSVNTLDDDRAKLYLAGNPLLYAHTSSVISTPYRRLITVSKSGDGSFITVRSDVQWVGMGRKFNYIVDTVFYNWRGE